MQAFSLRIFVADGDSRAVVESVPSMQQHVRGLYDLRQELVANGVLVLDCSASLDADTLSQGFITGCASGLLSGRPTLLGDVQAV